MKSSIEASSQGGSTAPVYFAAPLLGFAFGIGWTPCIGPTLGAVQVLAIQSATAERGAILSAAYCFGLGLPFILMGLFLDKSTPIRKIISSKGNLIVKVGGYFFDTDRSFTTY